MSADRKEPQGQDQPAHTSAGNDSPCDNVAGNSPSGAISWRPTDGGIEGDVHLDLWMVSSAAAQQLTITINRVAPTNVPVLIVGESGTGKEVAARAIHRASRRPGPFVPVNMAAVPRELAESQFFGHERGAFTGAGAAYVGYCEAAHAGTLFLDELTEMEIGLQSKLLRFLEDMTVRPLGATTSRQVDVRIVAATNRDPEQAVRDHHLREDIYYRLNVVSIRLPPLRDRPVDICRMANLFLIDANCRHRRSVEGFTPAVMKLLQAYHWPGNIRELKNCVERMVILTGDSRISLADLPDAILRNATGRTDLVVPSSTDPAAPRSALVRLEEQVILDELLKWDGNVRRTARSLGIARSTLYRRLKSIQRLRENDQPSPL